MRNPIHFLRSPYYVYLFARCLKRVHIPLVPRCLDYFIRFFYACWLPHTAKIGKNLELGYGGLGCVISAKATIGDNVHIGTNVTIGGNRREVGTPVIGNNVYIGGGAQILGPITIGDGSVIGANAVVIRDVPPKTVVAGNPARVVHEDIDIETYLLPSKR